MELIISVIVIALTVLGGFSVLAALTPNESDNKALKIILTTINAFGMNVLKAKNKIS